MGGGYRLPECVRSISMMQFGDLSETILSVESNWEARKEIAYQLAIC